MKIKLILSALIIALFLTACQQSVTTKPTLEASPSVTKMAEMMKLTIGVMPAVDAAPIFIAKDNGYYSELNLDVTIKVFTNAMDRQSALQTNTIDGAMSDMIALITNVQGGFDIKGTTMTDGMFPVLIKKGYVEKKEITVAMMEVSVSNYLADEWLTTDHTVKKIFINEIPSRLEMIKAGNADMGIFPEPMATMGSTDGVTKKIYEVKDGFSPDVLVFTGKALKDNDAAVTAFHLAYDKAVIDIQKDDSLARTILISKLNLKPEIKDLIDLPAYHKTRLPDSSYVKGIADWTGKVLKKTINITDSDIFERKFVSK
jgi:NitT/TauT family transport system substrate-binding protein